MINIIDNEEKDIALLYKYRSLSGENRTFVERTFLNNELYFPSPLSFNDPFDCKLSLSMQAREEDWKKYFNQLIKQEAPYLPRKARRAKASVAVKQGKHYSFVNNFDFFSSIVAPLGVFCLSEEPDQVLMWSHYADSHKGIVIGFKATRFTPFFGPALPIKYADKYPALNFLKNRKDLTLPILTTKSHHWRYEKEWRIIEYEKGFGYYSFPPELLVCVIIGCNISPENKKLVLSWCKQRKGELQIYQASKKEHEFGLKLDEIN